MKKFELVREVAKQCGHSQEIVSSVLDAACSVIVATAIDGGEEVNVPQLGKFKRKINAARRGVNPLTGKPIDIRESHTLAFRASSTLKRFIK